MATAFQLGTELLRTVQAHDGPRFHIGNANEQLYVSSVLVVLQRDNKRQELETYLRLLAEKVPEAEEIIKIAKVTTLGKPIADAFARVRSTPAT